MSKQMPKKVFIVRENEGTEDEILIADVDIYSLSCGEETLIGVYELKELCIAKLVTSVKTKKVL